MMKLHLNLATRDLAASVSFYRVLLQAEPVKSFRDYALFIAEDPGLELAIDADSAARVEGGDHFGIVAATADDVRQAIRRFADAGVATEIELHETCCYAVQDKVWVTDPDGRRWEVYCVIEDVAERDGDAPCRRDDAAAELPAVISAG